MLQARHVYCALVLAILLNLPLEAAATTSHVAMASLSARTILEGKTAISHTPAADTPSTTLATSTRVPLIHKKATTHDEATFIDEILWRNFSEVERLLNLGVSPYTCCHAWSAFGYVIVNGHCAMIKLLLDHGANPNDACSFRHLFNDEDYPDFERPLEDTSYFLLACRNLRSCSHSRMMLSVEKKIEVIKLLITHGANVNEIPRNGNSPLLCMAMNHPLLVSLLLSHGANPTTKNYLGKTALTICVQQHPYLLHLASLSRNPEQPSHYMSHYITAIKQLIESGCNPRAPDIEGKCALDYCRDPQIRCLLTRFPQYSVVQQMLKAYMPTELALLTVSYMNNDYENRDEKDFLNVRPPQQDQSCCIVS